MTGLKLLLITRHRAVYTACCSRRLVAAPAAATATASAAAMAAVTDDATSAATAVADAGCYPSRRFNPVAVDDCRMRTVVTLPLLSCVYAYFSYTTLANLRVCVL